MNYVKHMHHVLGNSEIVYIESRTASPIVPKPKTATVDDLWTLAIFQADPTPISNNIGSRLLVQ
jgi:hypothetical protein